MKVGRRKAEFGHDPISPADAADDDRREHSRILTVYRVARLNVESDAGLCRVQNISNTGMMLVTGLGVGEGDSVMIALSDQVVVPGEVTWVDGARVGIHFIEEIDAPSVLQSIAAASSTDQRPIRLPTDTVAVAVTPHSTKAVRVLDISQHGMKIGHEGDVAAGTQIKISFPNGLERRGIVRWANDDMAGVQLLEPIAFQELQNASKL